MDFQWNIPTLLMNIFAWTLIGWLAYRIFKKQTVRPAIWKIILIIWIGLFSFTINFSISQTDVKVPILPLGVWILYFIFKDKKERWLMFKNYAWLGFLGNFIFLAATLLSILLYHALYPIEDVTTYISKIEEPSVVVIHPSASENTIYKEKLQQALETMETHPIYSEAWYEKTYIENNENAIAERFPYLLTGTSPKWGSGIQTMIYVEDDGKGLLVSTPQQQFYFRSSISLWKGEE